MIKTFCDICGYEGDILKFSYPCHLDPSGKWGGYVDNEGNEVSGRHESKDCCRKCHNAIYSAAISKMSEMLEMLEIENIKTEK